MGVPSGSMRSPDQWRVTILVSRPKERQSAARWRGKMLPGLPMMTAGLSGIGSRGEIPALQLFEEAADWKRPVLVHAVRRPHLVPQVYAVHLRSQVARVRRIEHARPVIERDRA